MEVLLVMRRFLQWGGYICASVLALILVIRWYTLFVRYRQQRQRHQGVPTNAHGRHPHPHQILTFYHPYCAGGGGGERVLWKALEVLGTMVEKDGYSFLVVVLTIDPPSPTYGTQLLAQVQERFSIALSDKLKIQFVHLDNHCHLLQPSPYLSLVMESLGALRLAWQGLQECRRQGFAPHVFVDTTGAAFTFIPAVLLYACRVVAYVHYPTISTDMLQMVWERRRAAYNHAASIAQSPIKTAIKLLYYTIFAILYGAVGSLASLVMVNSTWTYNHIRFLWKGPAWRQTIQIVYPPCAVADLQSGRKPRPSKGKPQTIVSIGQFRPEKDHVLQIEAMARLLEQHPEFRKQQQQQQPVQLKLVGSCRNTDDKVRLGLLQELVRKLDLESHVVFEVNVSYSTIKTCLQQSSVGIHTMWNEHFGIGIVEMMAAGLLVVAHDSGGPRSDIVTPGETGFLATTVDEYAHALYKALTLSPAAALRMRQAAQQSAHRFSEEVFATSFRDTLIQANVLL